MAHAGLFFGLCRGVFDSSKAGFGSCRLVFWLMPGCFLTDAGVCLAQAGLHLVHAGLWLAHAGLCLADAGLCLAQAGLDLVHAGLCLVHTGLCLSVFASHNVDFSQYRAVVGPMDAKF